MAHEIHELDRIMLGNRMPAWHGIGKKIDGQATSAEALVHAELAWLVAKEQAYMLASNGQPVAAPGCFLNCRTDLERDDARRA